MTKPHFLGLSTVCLATLSGVSGPLLFLLAVIIIESLQPGYDPIDDTISMLVLGPYGWVQNLVFLLFSFLLVVFAIRLYVVLDRRKSSSIGIACLMLIALGFIILVFFPTSHGHVKSLPAQIHSYTARTMSMLFPIACFLIAPGFKRDSRWRAFFGYTVAAGVLAILTFPMGTIFEPQMGLLERILVLDGLVWIEIVSIRLLRFCLRERRLSASTVGGNHSNC